MDIFVYELMRWLFSNILIIINPVTHCTKKIRVPCEIAMSHLSSSGDGTTGTAGATAAAVDLQRVDGLGQWSSR